MRIAMLLHKSVEHDARVRREARALAGAGHEVTVVHLPRGAGGPGEAAAEGYELRSASPDGWAERLPGGARRALSAAAISRVAAATGPDVVHAHDAAMLAPGLLASRRAGATLVYDSHELATGVPYHSKLWTALVGSLERHVVPRCAGVITVSDGIAERLQRRYGLQRRPTVIRNVSDLPPPREVGGQVDDLRAELGVGTAPLAIHHGAVAADRGGEVLIGALARLDGAHLLFLGAEGPFAEGLERLAARLGVAERVHLRPPAPLAELLSFTAQADVGVTLLQDTCENHRLALPNKVFEYVAAGIPVLAADLPELRALIGRYGIGWTADPADAVAVAVALERAFASRGDDALAERLARAAVELSWGAESGKLLALYGALGPDGAAAAVPAA
jgi:glycosyltransferase involved in cell wall biosynthesis